MKKALFLPVAIVFAFASGACAQEAETAEAGVTEAAALDTTETKASYTIGYNLGRSLKEQEVPVTLDIIIQGLQDGFAGTDAQLTDQEMQETMQTFQQKMVARQQAKAEADGVENKAAGEEFLVANKEKPGVVTTESGLQYEVITAGDGPKPTADDRVSVHYTGTLLDGTKFDSSRDRGQPATFPVKGVIPGWIEALQLMPVGSKWKLYIPSDLAYAERGAGAQIGPHSTLIFEVELISIESQ